MQYRKIVSLCLNDSFYQDPSSFTFISSVSNFITQSCLSSILANMSDQFSMSWLLLNIKCNFFQFYLLLLLDQILLIFLVLCSLTSSSHFRIYSLIIYYIILSFSFSCSSRFFTLFLSEFNSSNKYPGSIPDSDTFFYFFYFLLSSHHTVDDSSGCLQTIFASDIALISYPNILSSFHLLLILTLTLLL